MRIATRLLVSVMLVAPAFAQETGPPEQIHVRTLNIVSDKLPDALRQQIIHDLQGMETDERAEELAERVRQHLRDAGYWNPAAEEPRVSKIAETPAGRFADVTVQVNPGAVYTLGEITFENVKAFPRDQLRAQFHSRTGEHVNATEIGRGLDNLRNLYASKGYANFGAIPKAMIDESRYVIDLTVDVDEGRPCSFGGFALEGVEPVAGAGKLLLDSWKKDMRGKLYNPELLKAWLVANTANWPDDSAARVHLDSGCGGTADAMALNVILHFQ